MTKTTVDFTFMSETQLICVDEIIEERGRQEDTWGQQDHHPAYWLAILGKQVGQFGSEVLNREWATGSIDNNKIRHEASQVAAVALAIMEACDRAMPAGIVTAKPSDPRMMAKVLNHGDEVINYDKDEPDVAFGEPGSEPCS